MHFRLQFMCLWQILFVASSWATGAELLQLNEENWDACVPAGKEVDCIYGDYVMRSDRIVAVVAKAVAARNANMTVKNVGGGVIDLTRRDAQSDQLSCFYPLGGDFRLSGPVDWPPAWKSESAAARLAFAAKPLGAAARDRDSVERIVGYELVDGEDHLSVLTLLTNATDQALTVPLADGVRADGEFETGHDAKLNLWWCYDSHWRGAYGLRWDEGGVPGPIENRRPLRIDYAVSPAKQGIVVPGKSSVTFRRRLIPAADTLAVGVVARTMQGEPLADVQLSITDAAGPVANALLEVRQADYLVGKTRADADGQVSTRLPIGKYTFLATAQGRRQLETSGRVVEGSNFLEIQFAPPGVGYLEGEITSESGEGLPCKIAFVGQGVADPQFGPDSAVHGVRNLWYTADGQFRVELAAGSYQLIISRGPEYDAELATIEVQPGETTRISKRLRRTVDTTGWISGELHSHSSPSGDNTSSQRGRVLNLLAEHLEFIPCTEHQRVTTYDEHLEHFGASARVLTCPGMELTGSPLPINHQNAFPLVHRPRTQDGGGPQTHVNPVVQIARLAMWDEGSDKVVQINHPNIAQMVGDADEDGRPDDGFRQMFASADVMEVHPLEVILETSTADDAGRNQRGPVIRNWMQLLNLGYRVPGVVNTDAHWNFHGSGWLRNYIRSSTDEPAEADLMETCHALERGQVVMTSGPFLEVEVSAGEERAGPGDDLRAEDGRVELHVRVQCPNWLDVNRVQVFVNGRADERFNFTRREHANRFANETVKFDQRLQLTLDQDAHLIVAAAGEGLNLGRVFGPEQGAGMPIAVSNPIFVDVDGEGFGPNGDLLDLPLPVEAGHRPTHGHQHVPPETQPDE
jgi:hypothetical protein